jgi:hypothetical protein
MMRTKSTEYSTFRWAVLKKVKGVTVMTEGQKEMIKTGFRHFRDNN